MRTILLVCTGNSCRSAMAAGALKELLGDKSNYQIVTAGTGAIKGMRATSEAIEAAAEQNIDISQHRSTPLTDEMIDQADIILVMARHHKNYILRHVPTSENKVHLLSEFGRMEQEKKLVDPDIPDPIGQSLEFYRRVFGIIKEGLLRVMKKLEDK